MTAVDCQPIIRPANESEADAVSSLVRDAYRPWVARFGREPSPIGEDYRQRIAAGQVWVLETERELAGMVMLRDGPEALLIPNIAVAPAEQGRGNGRQLIAFAIAEAARRGYREVWLHVNALMTENIAFYTHLGFAEIARIQGADHDRVYLTMAKTVP